jgi:8-oxo-dGTP pyrophosphatase MutT (NUDIX family)
MQQTPMMPMSEPRATRERRRNEIRQAVERHPAIDARERAHQARMLELLRLPGDVLSRDHFTPGHFTASAFIVSPDGGDLLLIYHARLCRWLQPGGHFDPEDPDLQAAVQREVWEETRVELEPAAGALAAAGSLLDLDVHAIPSRPDLAEPAHEHFDLRLFLRAASRAVAPGSDARAARWVPMAEMDGVETDESVRRVVAKLLRQGTRA